MKAHLYQGDIYVTIKANTGLVDFGNIYTTKAYQNTIRELISVLITVLETFESPPTLPKLFVLFGVQHVKQFANSEN